MPMASAISIAIAASWIVTGSFSTISSVTGFWMRTESPRSPCSTPESQYPYRSGSGSSRWNLARRYATTFGARSSPASAIAGSPGSSCCSPKIRIETKNSVGTRVARRCSRYFSTSIHSQALHAHQAVGHRTQAGKLRGMRPQPIAVVQIHDRPLFRHFGCDLLEQPGALRRIERGARAVDEIVQLGLADAGVVQRLLAREVDMQVAVRIGAPAPGEHVGLELAFVGQVERGRELGGLDLDVEAGVLRHRLHHLRDALRVGGCRRHEREARVRHARGREQRLGLRHVALRHRDVPRVIAVGGGDPLVTGDGLAVHRDFYQRIAVERELEGLAHACVPAERILLREVALADIDGDALVADLDDAVDLEAAVAPQA